MLAVQTLCFDSEAHHGTTGTLPPAVFDAIKCCPMAGTLRIDGTSDGFQAAAKFDHFSVWVSPVLLSHHL